MSPDGVHLNQVDFSTIGRRRLTSWRMSIVLDKRKETSSSRYYTLQVGRRLLAEKLAEQAALQEQRLNNCFELISDILTLSYIITFCFLF